MFYLADHTPSVDQGRQLASELIGNQSALQKFREIITQQGGDPGVIDDPQRLPQAQHQSPFLSRSSGFVTSIQCEQIGTASLVLGGGREKKEDVIDPAVGLVLHKKVGDPVREGEPLCTIHYNSDAQFADARALLQQAYLISEKPPASKRPLIHRVFLAKERRHDDPRSLCSEALRRHGPNLDRSSILKLHDQESPMSRLTGLLGLITMLAFAYVFSSNRRAIRVKTVVMGLVLQFVFAIFVLRFSFGRNLLAWAGRGVDKFLEYSFAGSQLVFGELGRKGGQFGMIFAFQVLPTVIFISAFFAVLYHYGVMQFIIRQAAKVMIRMGASGAESLDVAASIFMGQTEAPLTIRPYLPSLTRSELMTVMTAGMAHVSGGIMGAYILYGVKAEHLLSAVIMTAPGTVLMAKMFVPETEEPLTSPHRKTDTKTDATQTAKSTAEMDIEAMPKDENVLGAITRGTIDGLHLALTSQPC